MNDDVRDDDERPLFFVDDEDDDEIEFSLSSNFTSMPTNDDDDDDDDEIEFILPASKSSGYDEDEDEVFSLAVQTQATSLVEFVATPEEELRDYTYNLQLIDHLKGLRRVTTEVISDKIHSYLKDRLKPIYPGYSTNFTSQKYRTRMNLIEYLRKYVIDKASSVVHDRGDGCDHRTTQLQILDIFLKEKISTPDQNIVIQKIADAVMDTYSMAVNDLKASLSAEAGRVPIPVHPKQIYTHGYVCECGYFQKTERPMPALIMNNANYTYYHEQTRCKNCDRDIIVPKEIVDTLTTLLLAAITAFPQMSKGSFGIYRPPLSSIHIPPHLSNTLLYDSDDIEDEEKEPPSLAITSLYKELVNAWTLSHVAGEDNYLTQLFNSKTYPFDLRQEWRDWSATLVYYFENNGVYTLTPWADARYHYTKQPHMNSSETSKFLLDNLHWLAGLRIVRSTIDSPDFKPEFHDLIKRIFMLRCLAKTPHWEDDKLRSLMNNEAFSFSTVVSTNKSPDGDCSKGLVHRHDSVVLPTVKVFEDYDLLEAYLSGAPIPAAKSDYIPSRENFPEFVRLLQGNYAKLLGTNITELPLVQRVRILNWMETATLLYEGVSSSFENSSDLEFSDSADYKLISYIRLSDNLPDDLLELRNIAKLKDVADYIRKNDDVQQDIANINPAWADEL